MKVAPDQEVGSGRQRLVAAVRRKKRMVWRERARGQGDDVDGAVAQHPQARDQICLSHEERDERHGERAGRKGVAIVQDDDVVTFGTPQSFGQRRAPGCRTDVDGERLDRYGGLGGE